MTTLTTEEIVNIAKQSGLGFLLEAGFMCHQEVKDFAKLVADKATAKAAEREREACAEICDAINAVYTKPEDAAERVASQWCAERIRARGAEAT